MKYDIEKIYLYEVFEEYRDSNNEEEKIKIWINFCDTIWSVPNKRQVYERNIKYKVLTSENSEIEEIFKGYSSIPYLTYRSRTCNLNSWHLLRQRINNIFSKMCDPAICEKDDYFSALSTARAFYYKWYDSNLELTPDELRLQIENSVYRAEELLKVYSKQKLSITWIQYKKVINDFLLKCLNNYIPCSEYQNQSAVLNIDFWNDDNYVVKYIGKSLFGYMKNYEKEHYGISRKNGRDKRKYIKCEDCGKTFLVSSKTNNIKRCPICNKEHIKKYDRERKSKKFRISN